MQHPVSTACLGAVRVKVVREAVTRGNQVQRPGKGPDAGRQPEVARRCVGGGRKHQRDGWVTRRFCNSAQARRLSRAVLRCIGGSSHETGKGRDSLAHSDSCALRPS